MAEDAPADATAAPQGPRWSLQRRLWRHLLALLAAGWLAACATGAAGLWHEVDEVLDGALQQTALRRVRIILAFAAAALVLAVGMLVLLVLRVLARLG